MVPPERVQDIVQTLQLTDYYELPSRGAEDAEMVFERITEEMHRRDPDR
jgi:hypothetical protein